MKIKPDDFVINGLDNDGNKIERIYLKSMEYTVYRTKGSIRIDMDDDSDKLGMYVSNHHRLGVGLARIYSFLPTNLSWSEAINKQVARAIFVNVAGRYEDALQMLSHAEQRIIKLKTIQGRLQYTLSSFAMVVFVLFTLLVVKGNGLVEYLRYLEVALCGALGGVLSVAVGYSSLHVDIDANGKTNCMIGMSRILISISAALFSYFAVKSEIIFTFVASQHTNDGLYLVAMVAGFSEMLVPSIMNNLSDKSASQVSPAPAPAPAPAPVILTPPIPSSAPADQQS
ncbi:hypothetical protein [Pseudomonas synxantha]|uniref:Uncharacterized protein n=1 Tax=Pseudomonas synxantha TaxID=47883 RepID=A0ACC6JSE4_9PSED|nr:hypothetical protein [Pseudomonas synxantha]MDR6609072.1 hypothetical protein [Pseudomonas synxantha]